MRRALMLLVGLWLVVACCTTRQNNSSYDPEATTGPSQGETRIDEPAETRDSLPPAQASTIAAVVNTEYEPVVLNLIDGATQQIRVVQFEAHDDEVIDAIITRLIAARARGVEITVVLENEVEDNTDRVEELTAAGIEARLDTPKRYTHTKLVVVDQRRVLFGSTNWSWKSIQENNETNLLIDSPIVGPYYDAYAQFVFENPEDVPKLTPVTDAAIGVTRTFHDDEYVTVVQPLLSGAKKRIDLLIYAIHLNPDYPDSDVHLMVGELSAAAQRGVKVRVILELSDYNDWLNEMNQNTANQLDAGGVEVRFELPGKISHAKLIVVDDSVVVETNNWGHGGFHLYHEIGAVVAHPPVTERFAAYFQQIWDDGSSAVER